MTSKLKDLVYRSPAPGSRVHRAPEGLIKLAAVSPRDLSPTATVDPMNGAAGSKPVSKRLHRKQAAAYIGVSLSWLDKSRLRGDGPPFLQIGGRVLYDLGDLNEYLARCRRRSTSEVP